MHEAMPRLPDRIPSRVIIEGVEPEIDGGRFPIKRAVGEEVVVAADIYADGHDALAAVLRYRHAAETEWKEVSMEAHGNDRWTARFTVTAIGRYEYTAQAWIDRFPSISSTTRTPTTASMTNEVTHCISSRSFQRRTAGRRCSATLNRVPGDSRRSSQSCCVSGAMALRRL